VVRDSGCMRSSNLSLGVDHESVSHIRKTGRSRDHRGLGRAGSSLSGARFGGEATVGIDGDVNGVGVFAAPKPGGRYPDGLSRENLRPQVPIGHYELRP
jgi:hypothetical protein